eukprot:scaffold22560_cov92-Amphora_coffeaeformis.AAC.1
MEHERTKRNSIYSGPPLVLYELVVTFPAVANYDVVEQASWSVSRAFVTAQSVIYLVELFYRIDPRWEVILHHLIPAALVIFLYYVADRTYAVMLAMKLAMILILMALTEQPFYLALLLKNLRYTDRFWWPPLCRFAGWFFILAKL